MIKNIIFDIGRVLVGFNWQKYICDRYGEETGMILRKAIWGHGYWQQLDYGILPEEEVIENFIRFEPDYAEQIRDGFLNTGDCMSRLDYAIPWMKELKERGYNVYFLSNYSPFLIRIRPDVLDFIPFMDGGIFSCDVHVCKPDRAIYEMLCKKYDLKPEECVFLDDRADNIGGAIAYGMKGIVFENREQALKELEPMLQES